MKAKFREKEGFSKQREIIFWGDENRKVENKIAWKLAFAFSLRLSQFLLINHARETLLLLLLAFLPEIQALEFHPADKLCNNIKNTHFIFLTLVISLPELCSKRPWRKCL